MASLARSVRTSATFKGLRASAEIERQNAEGLRDAAYEQAEQARDDLYDIAEANRDTLVASINSQLADVVNDLDEHKLDYASNQITDTISNEITVKTTLIELDENE